MHENKMGCVSKQFVVHDFVFCCFKAFRVK